MQRFRDTQPEYSKPETSTFQIYRDTGIQGYRDTGIQGYRDTGIQEYRDTGIYNQNIVHQKLQFFKRF